MRHPDFSRCLKAGTAKLHIYTLSKGNPEVLCTGKNFLPKCLVINLRHIRETNTQFLRIGSNQRIRNRVENMVRKKHEVSRLIGRVRRAAGVGQEEDFRSHKVHQTFRKNHLFYGIPLIKVYSSLHNDYRHGADMAKNKSSLVSAYRRYRKIRNLMIIDACLDFDSFRIISQPRTEYQRQTRAKRNLILNTFITTLQSLVNLCHLFPAFSIGNLLPSDN